MTPDLTRRDFLRATTAAAVTSGLAGAPLRAAETADALAFSASDAHLRLSRATG